MEKEKTPIMKILTPEKEGDGFIPLNRDLIAGLGLNSALVITELATIYEFYKSKHKLNKHGEFYSTLSRLEITTGIKRKAQEKAIDDLTKKKFIIRVVNRKTPKKRHFLLSEKLEELLTEYIEIGSKKIILVKQKDAEKAVTYKKAISKKRNLRVSQKTYLNVPKDILECPKEQISMDEKTINKNKSENNKKNNKQDKECLSVPTEVKDKEYITLVDKLMDTFPNKTKSQIEVKIDKILKEEEFTCEDLNLGFDYKTEKGTIEYLLSEKSGEEQFNNILSSIKLGVKLAKDEEFENELEDYPSNGYNNSTPGDKEDSTPISEKEHNFKISSEDRKQLEFLKPMLSKLTSIEHCVKLFTDFPKAKENYKNILKPFAEPTILIERFSRKDMVNFCMAYKAIQQLEAS